MPKHENTVIVYLNIWKYVIIRHFRMVIQQSKVADTGAEVGFVHFGCVLQLLAGYTHYEARALYAEHLLLVSTGVPLYQ